MTQVATREKWKALIRRQAESGESVQEFCGAKGVSTASFYAWKRKLRDDGGEEKCGGGEQRIFTPVTVVGRSAAAIEICFPSGAVMRLPAGDGQSLRRVTEMLLGDRP